MLKMKITQCAGHKHPSLCDCMAVHSQGSYGSLIESCIHVYMYFAYMYMYIHVHKIPEIHVQCACNTNLVTTCIYMHVQSTPLHIILQ